MKTRNPNSRRHLKIKKTDFVLEVGGGHNPCARSNIIVEKFYDSNFHRSDDVKFYDNQFLVIADGENLPFKDKTFNYVISNHVLEHAEDPARFLDELSRVGERGYVEAPSLIGEHLIPKISHTWAILELDNKIVMMRIKDTGYIPKMDFGDLLLYFIAQKSIGFKILHKTYPNLLTVRYEWKDKIDYVIEPEDTELRSFFTTKWDMDKIAKVFKNKSKMEEILTASYAMLEIMIDFVKARFSPSHQKAHIV